LITELFAKLKSAEVDIKKENHDSRRYQGWHSAAITTPSYNGFLVTHNQIGATDLSYEFITHLKAFGIISQLMPPGTP
jgi:hypothetical protein